MLGLYILGAAGLAGLGLGAYALLHESGPTAQGSTQIAPVRPPDVGTQIGQVGTTVGSVASTVGALGGNPQSSQIIQGLGGLLTGLGGLTSGIVGLTAGNGGGRAGGGVSSLFGGGSADDSFPGPVLGGGGSSGGGDLGIVPDDIDPSYNDFVFD